MSKKSKKINKTWYFLLIVIILYIILFFTSYSSFTKSLSFFLNILEIIIPIFMLVFVLTFLMNYFVTKKFILKHFSEKGIKAWVFAIITGILSLGPIYIWYPLLAEAKNKGFSYGLIACFLYNRAIKIPLLPLIILYFGIKYALILTIVMIMASVLQGIIINKTIEVKN